MGDNKYRNCFYYEEGWDVVTCDFASQEAVVAATVCKEEKMLAVFENGWDFHSVCASLLFPDEWKELGGDPNPTGKPDNPILVKKRNDSKKTSFGLFYGKSAMGLAEDLGLPLDTKELVQRYSIDIDTFIENNKEEYDRFLLINNNNKDNITGLILFVKQMREEKRLLPDIITASELVDRFFNVFPNIKTVLVGGAVVAANKCYIATPDEFQRIRFFNRPEDTKEAKAIEREAMNFPIQGTSGNMTKLAIARVYKYIEENDLHDKVKFFLPIHDEIVCVAKTEYSQTWALKLQEIMEQAGADILGHNLQKAEYNISKVWEK